MWCTQNPHSAKTDLHAGQPATLVPKHFTMVKFSIPIEIFQNDDTVTQVRFETDGRLGIGIIFGDP